MKVQVGQIAPNFSITDIFGNNVQLADYKGKKILLGFYRNANCPFCNRRVHQIMLNNISFKQKDVQLLFFFESSAEILKKSSFHTGISPWPLIGDPDRKIYSQYGVETSPLKMMKTMFVSSLGQAKKDTAQLNLPEDKAATMSLIPADIFIDENFKIVKAHYGKHLDDHIEYNELLKFAGINDPFKNIKSTK
ncbi:MAG: peroxiredoxin family protein [Prolixibacteraceae bacterium]